MEEKRNIACYNVFKDLFWVFLFYVVGDVVTTYIVLPYAVEGNPIVFKILSSTGFAGLIVVKIVFMVAMYYASGYMIPRGYLNVWKLLVKVILLLGIMLTINNTIVYLAGTGLI